MEFGDFPDGIFFPIVVHKILIDRRRSRILSSHFEVALLESVDERASL